MDVAPYTAIWNRLEPNMTALLECIGQQVSARTGLAPITAPVKGGDEEFKLSIDWKRPGDDQPVAGVDIVLADADVRGEGGGLNVMIEVQGYGGRTLGVYIPENYTEDAFTEDVEVLESRLEEIKSDASEFADLIARHLSDTQNSRPSPKG